MKVTHQPQLRYARTAPRPAGQEQTPSEDRVQFSGLKAAALGIAGVGLLASPAMAATAGAAAQPETYGLAARTVQGAVNVLKASGPAGMGAALLGGVGFGVGLFGGAPDNEPGLGPAIALGVMGGLVGGAFGGAIMLMQAVL